MSYLPINVRYLTTERHIVLRFCIGLVLSLILACISAECIAAPRYSSSVEIVLLKQRIEQLQQGLNQSLQQQKAQEELFRQITLDLQKQKSLTEIIQKQLENSLRDNEARIEDIYQAMNRSGIILSISIGLFGALIIGIIVVFAIRTEKSARMTAENEIKSWINERENFRAKELLDDKIKSTFERFNQEAEKAFSHISQPNMSAPNAGNWDSNWDSRPIEINKPPEKSRGHIESLQELTLDNVSYRLAQDPALKRALHDRIKLVIVIPEEQRSFYDWYYLLLDAWNNKEFHQALRCANQARKSAVTDIEIARSVSSQSACLQATGHTEEAIACFDEVIDRYGERNDTDFAVVLAKSMYNKGLTLRQRYTDAALSQYDQLIKRFCNNPEADVVEIVAGAMLRKAATMEQLNDFSAAISQYEEIVIRYGERREPNIVAEVEKARIAIERLTFGSYSRFDQFRCSESG